MSNIDDKTISKPKPALKQMMVPRIVSSGYEIKNTFEPAEIAEPKKEKLNINAPSFKPKSTVKQTSMLSIYNFTSVPPENTPEPYKPYQSTGFNPMPKYPAQSGYQPRYQPPVYPPDYQYMKPQYNPPMHNSAYPQHQPLHGYVQPQATGPSLAKSTLNLDAPEYNPSKGLNKESKPYVPKLLKEEKKKKEEEEATALTMKKKLEEEEAALKKQQEEKEASAKAFALKKRQEEDATAKALDLKKKQEEEATEALALTLKKRKEEEEAAARKKQEEQLKQAKLEQEDESKTTNIKKGTSKLSDIFNNNKKTTYTKPIPVIETYQTSTKPYKVKQEEETHKKKEELKKKQKLQEDIKRQEEEDKRRLLQEEKRRQEEEEQRRQKLQREKEEEEEQGRIEKQEQEQEAKAKQEEIKSHIERHYFLVYDNIKSATEPNDRVYNLEYMSSFKNWKICKETKLLSESLKKHLESFNDFEDELPGSKSGKDYQRGINRYNNKRDINDSKTERNKKPDFFIRGTEAPSIPTGEIDMKMWGRKDITKELEMAESFKTKLDEIKQADPVKFDLTEMLNILTVDNYDETKLSIFNKISQSVEYQEKFLDVLFKKAVHEKAFVYLYAKLCKELDKELPQKTDKSKNAKPTSAMRSKLLDKCREIFKIENNTKFDSYIKVTDPVERENKLKKFVLGNVNFIGELINIQMLSKKIVFQCIDNLFKRYDKQDGDDKLRLINLEAIVILIDKFGTLITKTEKKIKSDEMIEFQKKIDICMDKLNGMQLNDKLPGHIKYKIINLIEKKKAGWEESLFEKTTTAKGKDEVRKEYENSQKKGLGTGKDKKLDQDQVNSKVRDDLYSWKEYIEDERPIDHYPWDIITDLYSNKQNTIAEILLAFIENCLDFVQKEKTLQYANLYFKEFIGFYANKMTKEEKHEVIEVVLELLQNVTNLTLDNHFIVDVWASILFELNKSNIMAYASLGRIHDIYEDDLKCLMVMLSKIHKLEHEDKAILVDFKKFGFVQDNVELFNEQLGL